MHYINYGVSLGLSREKPPVEHCCTVRSCFINKTYIYLESSLLKSSTPSSSQQNDMFPLTFVSPFLCSLFTQKNRGKKIKKMAFRSPICMRSLGEGATVECAQDGRVKKANVMGRDGAPVQGSVSRRSNGVGWVQDRKIRERKNPLVKILKIILLFLSFHFLNFS